MRMTPVTSRLPPPTTSGVVVSWNFRHMVNIERKRKINSVNLREGLPLIDIVSPWEVNDEEE